MYESIIIHVITILQLKFKILFSYCFVSIISIVGRGQQYESNVVTKTLKYFFYYIGFGLLKPLIGHESWSHMSLNDDNSSIWNLAWKLQQNCSKKNTGKGIFRNTCTVIIISSNSH